MQEYIDIHRLYQPNFDPGAVVPDFATQAEALRQLPDKGAESHPLHLAADAKQ
jgi:hypothetical protein